MSPATTTALAGLAVVAGLMTLVWVVSLVRRDASIVDVFWGLGFVVVAWFYARRGPVGDWRALLVPCLVTLWGLRLSLYILWRNHGKGEDYRYAAMREKYGRKFPLLSLPIVFWLQAVILWVVALPLLRVQTAPGPPGWTAFDVAGLALFATGFLFESVGDLQLARFKADPANRGRVMDGGLWRYTRHPNYFGDALLWWGLFLFALAAPGGWWTAVGPALMTFMLMRVSGVALLEKTLRDTKPAYRDYVRRTSAFFPWPPKPAAAGEAGRTESR